MPSESLTTEQRRALQIIENAPNGCTEPALQAQGFTLAMMIGMAGAGLVSGRPYIIRVGGRAFGVVRFVITDAGRRAINHIDGVRP